MPSTFTTRARLEKQGSGENDNSWGQRLNENVFDLIDAMSKGVESFTLSGSKTLTSVNGTDDEARNAVLYITGGTGGTITIPSVEWQYLVVNAASGAVTITNGGSSDSVQAGEAAFVWTDGTTVEKAINTEYGGKRLTNLGAPTDNADAATKLYVDNTAFNAVDLPAQTGNTGKFLTTDGTNASWSAPSFPFTLMAGDVTAVAGNHYGADSDTAARTVTLPAGPSDGDEVKVSDVGGNALNNNVTLMRNGQTIGGSATDFVIDINYGFVSLRWNASASDWLIVEKG